MIETITDNLQTIGPVFAAVWAVTIGATLWRPQHYINSLLLMFSLLVTVIFVSGFLPGYAGDYFLLACFLLAMLVLLLVPALLIINGIQMIRREGFCLAHCLSLGLGLVVGVGEIATFVYVLSVSDALDIGRANYWLLLLAFTVFYLSFLVLSFVVYSVFIQIIPRRTQFDYIIIHGCGLSGGERLTKLLSNRVDKAIEVYRRCERKPVIIPSGGRGSDEKISEAQAMKNYLVDHGIPEMHIALESRSATTRENLLFSKQLIDSCPGEKKTALVSSNYHIYRCLCLAREVGLKCTGIGAKVAFYYWPSALIREFVAVFLTKRFLIWAMLGWLAFISPAIAMILYG